MKASGEAGAALLRDELSVKLKESLDSITANLPDRLKFSFDTEKIVSASLADLPPGGEIAVSALL